MLLVKENLYDCHVSIDTANEFEKVILDDKKNKPANSINKFMYKILFFVYRICKKRGYSIVRSTKKRYSSNPLFDKEHLFVVMMGLDINKFRRYCLFTKHTRSIYLFDAWPQDYKKIIDFITEFKIDYLFVTSSQSAKYLAKELSNMNVFWIPEGINPYEYKHLSIENKTIDILALGRKYDYYHEQIVNYCETKNLKYLFEKIKGELVFPTRQGFIEGLASSKISICVPSNITHPQRSGDVETMTIRYLQSMVSKCLILGHAPLELIELFGYNPVIEINKESPVEQLEHILKNYSDYTSLIEKNYQMVFLKHTWELRWEKIKQIYLENK